MYGVSELVRELISSAKEFDEIIKYFSYDPLHAEYTFYDHHSRAVKISAISFLSRHDGLEYVDHLFRSGEPNFSAAELTELL